MTEIIREDTSPEIAELEYGQPFRPFEGSAMDGKGVVHVPERRITLPGIPVTATVKGLLHLAEEFDDKHFWDFDQDLVARLDKTHTPDLVFNPKGHIYALRNIYPFGKNLVDGSGIPTRFAQLTITISFDLGSGLDDPEYLDWLDDMIENPEEDPGAFQLRFEINQANRFAAMNLNEVDFSDFERLQRQLLMLSVGEHTAFAAYNEEDHIMSPSPGAFLYDQFGIVGGNEYYDALTSEAPGMLGFVGGRLLVPYDSKPLSTIEMRVISPDDYEKAVAATTG